MSALASLLAGIVFAVGLIVSGMTNPAKVLNFLDVAGTWDPSLAFVMAGAILTTVIGYRLVLTRGKPLFAERFHLPTRTAIDRPLIVGSALFGVGWGLGGYCPGPAVTMLTTVTPSLMIFLAAMLAGMWAARAIQPRDGRDAATGRTGPVMGRTPVS